MTEIRQGLETDVDISIYAKPEYEIVDSKETDNVYCYEMEINGKHGVIVYPDEIDE